MKIEIFGNDINARVFMEVPGKPKAAKLMLFSGYAADARRFAARFTDAININKFHGAGAVTFYDHTKKEFRGAEWQFIAFDEASSVQVGGEFFYRPACWKVADDVDAKKIADELKRKADVIVKEAKEKEQQELAAIVRRRKAFEQAREEVINACSILDCPYTRQDIRDRAEVLLREDSAR